MLFVLSISPYLVLYCFSCEFSFFVLSISPYLVLYCFRCLNPYIDQKSVVTVNKRRKKNFP